MLFRSLEEYVAASWISRVSNNPPFDSDQETESYKWLGMPPVMREWIGGRHAHGFRENGITVTNKLFEATLEVPVDWMRRDKTGQIQIRINELADRAAGHWGQLLSTLIQNGTGATSGYCYDGQFFFDNDHSEGESGSQKNLLTNAEVGALDVAAATTPTASEAVKAILGVIGYMLGYKDDKGQPMNANARKFLVMTGVQLWPYLCPAVVAPAITSGETNVIRELAKEGFQVDIAANPRLTGFTDKFLVFRTDAPAPALIRQQEQDIEVDALAENSDEEFKNRRHLYGLTTSRNVAYGYWQNAAHATLS
jgi:phage major head subunit gpT-like protein